VADLQRAGALLSAEDLAAHKTLLAPSLQVAYRGRDVHLPPPNSPGLALAALLGLWQALGRDGNRTPEPAEFLRTRRIAFTLRDRYVTDAIRADLPPDALQSDILGRLLQDPDDTGEAEARAGGSDTRTLVVIDRWGDAVHGLVPGMRPFHTLCPALVVGQNGCEMAIATPGDHGQPQAIFQVLARYYDGQCNIQKAIELPRIRRDEGRDVLLESRAPSHWAAAITDCGLRPRDVGAWSRLTGGVNAIVRRPDGLLMAGADPRRASYAVCA
jgi:gamma-glutamyltranspeptidase/glutathione hydrolase